MGLCHPQIGVIFTIMKEYITGIEEILGESLSSSNIQSYEFKTPVIEKLIAFASDYKISSDVLSKSGQLVCFLSMPGLINCTFNSFCSSGDIQHHWPQKTEILNALIFNDRIMIYDNMRSFAESSLSGYVVGKQYNGIRNWLTSIAMYRDLIHEDFICIIPKKLSYSKGILRSWEDELFDISKKIFCSNEGYDPKDTYIGFDDDYYFEIIDISYLMGALSITAGDRKSIPYLNNNLMFIKYKENIDTLMDQLLDEYPWGKEPGKTLEDRYTFSNHVVLKAKYLPESKVELQSQLYDLHNNTKTLRKEIKAILSEAKKSILFDPHKKIEFTHMMDKKFNEWDQHIKKASLAGNSETIKIRIKLSSCILNGITDEKDDIVHHAWKSVFKAINNFKEYTIDPGQMMNYCFALAT